MLLSFATFGVLVLAAVLFPGVIAWVKAKLNGRKGASVLQPVYDIIRLMGKGSVYADSTSWVLRVAPTIFLATSLLALLLVPLEPVPALLSFPGDVVLFAYALGLGRFFLILNALDVGSGFEGMGAKREALYAMLLEPAFFILMGSLAMLTGYDSFQKLLAAVHYDQTVLWLVGALVAVVLVNVAMVENSRMPVDDPRTHLELTMVHEVMILDNSGIDLAYIHIANALKFAAFGGILADMFIPAHWPVGLNVLGMLGIQFAFAATVGVMESFRARLKMRRNPLFIASLSALALLVFLTALVSRG